MVGFGPVTRRQFLALMAPLLAVMIGFLALFWLERSGRSGAAPWDDDFFLDVRRTMADEFVWGVPDGEEGWGHYFRAVNAWLRGIDPYARVTPPWQVAASREQSSGRYGGIGIRPEVVSGDEAPESVGIVGVKPGGPAAEAGVVVGDRIVAVEGREVPAIWGTDGVSEGSVRLADAIRGEPGTRVSLKLRNAAGDERSVLVSRRRIDKGTVFGTEMIDDEHKIGYVRVEGFQADTSRELRAEIDTLLEDGMRALVLDLRDNAGGYLDQAVAVADTFLSKGVIVRQRGRRAEFTQTYEATSEGTIDPSIALAVITDRGSASASEVLAGALRDHGRAVLIGERTYGKFLVQVVEEMPTAAGPALFTRTTSVYETPSAHQYQRRGRTDPLAGIEPDVRVLLTQEERARLADVYQHQVYERWNPGLVPDYGEFVDRQLQAAVRVLAGETVTPRIPLLARAG